MKNIVAVELIMFITTLVPLLHPTAILSACPLKHSTRRTVLEMALHFNFDFNFARIITIVIIVIVIIIIVIIIIIGRQLAFKRNWNES